jgi:ankyrin repeat protein
MTRFRWATCQLDALADCLDYPQLTQALANLPPTLDATYGRILDQIPERYREQSIGILQVLTWSERPLRIEEAVDFLAVNPYRQPGFDERNRMPVPREIVRLCSSLVTIVHVPHVKIRYLSRITDKDENQTVQEMRLSHFSVKEYLTSDRLDERFRQCLCQAAASANIARVLITYLLHTEPRMRLRELKSKFPLCEYSARYWMSFTRHAELGSETVQNMSIQQLSDDEHFAKWRSIYDPDMPWVEEPEMSAQLPQPLYYASMEGLEYATAALIDRGAGINAQGGRYGNALQAACGEGHEKIAEMLVKNGAEVNSQDWLYNNALQAACEGGHEKIAEMLVEHGADVNVLDRMGSSALTIACAAGHEKIAVMLLEKGADVKGSAGPNGGALAAACAKGLEKVAMMLLEKGADINAPDEMGSSALAAACVKGLGKVAMILLEKGADVNAPDGPNGNALVAACAKGLEKVAMMLLEKGADINASDGLYGSALHAASNGGSPEVEKLLIEAHAEDIPPSQLVGHQVQLLILGQQKRKRLIMAWQEQDVVNRQRTL